MSQNVFLIDPIFFVPIDEEYSKRKEKHNKCDNAKSKKIKNMAGLDKFRDIDIIRRNHLKNMISIPEKNKSPSNNSQDNNQEIIIFSSTINDRNIKSMSNSSKIYISEIFKRNWKLKSRRLITKLKKKLIKQWTQTYNKEINDINANLINTCSNNKIIINSQSNNTNYNDSEFNNYYIYNNNVKNNNTILTNNINNINFVNMDNVYKALYFGYKNNNKNLNISRNLVFNYSEIPNINFNYIGKNF
jgi:hypothetical protein